MARILAYTTPARGHLFPVTPILAELRSRGHEISVRTLGSEVELARSLGFATEPIDPAVEAVEHDDFRARTPMGALKRGLSVFTRRAPLDAADLRRALEEERPDALIVDVNAWGALAVAEASGLPWAVFCPYPLPLPSRDAPPFGPGFAPARGPLGRLRDRVLSPLIVGGHERLVLPPVNAIRAEQGLAPLAGTGELFASAPLTLYMTAEPFEYPRSDWPTGIRMVGPCAWDPPSDPPAWLAGIDRPIVLVTTSSEFQDDGRLVRTAFEALAGEDVHVVATLPAQEPEGFTVPANATAERFVPHGHVLERAVCAITHGGMGATQKALQHGVPVCVVPFGRDQLEVARRVEVAGAGTRLPASRLRPDRLAAAVREARACAPGARRVAEGYAATGGPRTAADAFEALAGAVPVSA